VLDRVQTEWPSCVLVRADERWEADLGFWIDTHLRRDYFLPRRQLRELLSRPNSDTWVIVVGSEVVGLAVVWGELRLHNLFLDAGWRGKGIGTVIVRALGIEEVRAKRDMSTGDPKPFYQAIGFKTQEIQGKNGTIEVMTRDGNGERYAGDTITAEELAALKADAARWAAAKASATARAKAAAKTRNEKRRGKTESHKVKPGTSLHEAAAESKTNLQGEKKSEENAIARIGH